MESKLILLVLLFDVPIELLHRVRVAAALELAVQVLGAEKQESGARAGTAGERGGAHVLSVALVQEEDLRVALDAELARRLGLISGVHLCELQAGRG